MATAASAKELRDFLDQCVNSVQPIVYTDRNGKAHQVNLISVNEVTITEQAGRDETVLSLTMVEAAPETLEGGATGARAQEIFLLQALDSVVPLTYNNEKWGRQRVFLTAMEKSHRRSKTTPDEWRYALTMVDAWGGVWIYEAPEIKISVTQTVTLRPHVTAKWGTDTWGFFQYGT